MNNHQRFLALYGNNKHRSSLGCNGLSKLGDEYVCPSPSLSPCSVGQLAHCAQAQVQAGGGTATGEIAPSNVPQHKAIPITGYYADVAAAPIGGRPVYSAHDNVSVNNPTELKGNLLDHKFDCRQPLWCGKCI